jgi:hypothetical protein
MVLIEFMGMTSSLRFLEDSKPWFKLVVSGQTKGNQLSGACVATTQGSALEPGKWMKRLVETLRGCQVRKGRFFQRKLASPRLYEFEDDFFTVLEKIQSTADWIADSVDVRDAYGMLRSTR